MTVKLRIKTKNIEIEWDGEVEFLKAEFADLLSSIVDAIGGRTDDVDDIESPSLISDGKSFTTSSLAAKWQPKSAGELFKLALYKLQVSDRIEPAPRAQIHNEMKTAPKFYKPAMLSNMGRTIDALLAQGDLNEPSTGQFALSHEAQQKIHEKI
jgi:hypothetical protein